MHKNLRYTLMIVALMVIIVIGLFYYMPNHDLGNNNPVFIKTIGDWSISNKSDIVFNILFFDHKKSSIFDRQNNLKISFDSDIDVETYIVNSGTAYKDMRLYSIFISAKSEEVGEHNISKIYLVHQGETILESEIGKIKIKVIDDKQDDFEIIEHMGSSEIFSKYLFSVRNSSGRVIIVDEIQVGSFAQYIDSIDLYINGESIKSYGKIKLTPGDQLDGVMLFNDKCDRFNLYFFAPSLTYQIVDGAEQNEYAIPHAVYGLPVYEKTLEDIYLLYKSPERQ